MISLFFLSLACTSDAPTTTPSEVDTDTDTDTDTGGDTDTDTDTDTDDPVVIPDVTVTMSSTIGAVAVVSFTAEAEGQGVVQFGEQDRDAIYTVDAALQDDGSWRAVLVGVPSDSTGWLQVGIDEQYDATIHTYTTGPAPDWLSSELSGESSVQGFYALAVMGKARGAVIVTTEGRPVWWWSAPLDAPGILSRVQLSPEHDTVWFNAFNIESFGANNDDGMLVGVALDGSSEETLSLPTAHHDFLIRPDGVVALPMLDDREVDGRMVRGDSIVELAEDGAQRTVWSSWDAFPYLVEPTSPPDWWVMLNHLQWVEESGDYVASLKNMTTLVRVDGESGETEWSISENESYGTLTPDDGFYRQHGFHVPDDESLLLFDNDGAGGHSRVIRMALSPEEERAETVAIYDGDVSSLIMGDVVELSDGGLLVCYSSAARLDAMTADGDILSQLSFPTMVNVGYITHLPAIGPGAAVR
ncbi:MAG: arylsulfotransferase family protein [Myxococcota bacterium]|nr:arylsulfotransferase family protein [Myxococcota bacterium]